MKFNLLIIHMNYQLLKYLYINTSAYNNGINDAYRHWYYWYVTQNFLFRCVFRLKIFDFLNQRGYKISINT